MSSHKSPFFSLVHNLKPLDVSLNKGINQINTKKNHIVVATHHSLSLNTEYVSLLVCRLLICLFADACSHSHTPMYCENASSPQPCHIQLTKLHLNTRGKYAAGLTNISKILLQPSALEKNKNKQYKSLVKAKRVYFNGSYIANEIMFGCRSSLVRLHLLAPTSTGPPETMGDLTLSKKTSCCFSTINTDIES